MIKIDYIEEVPKKYWLEYKGQFYPLYEAGVFLDDSIREEYITFATDSLADVIIDLEMGEGKDAECRYIDNQIYGYVPDNLSLEEIKEYIINNFD